MTFQKYMCEVFEYAMSNPTQQTATTKEQYTAPIMPSQVISRMLEVIEMSETKLKSILLGGVFQMRSQKAFDLCQDFSKRGNNIFGSTNSLIQVKLVIPNYPIKKLILYFNPKLFQLLCNEFRRLLLRPALCFLFLR